LARSHAAWPVVAILLVMATVAFLDRQIISLLVQPIKADLGISDAEVGALMGVAFGLFYALFSYPLGALIDRYQPRLIIFAGITLWSLAAMSCGLAASFWQLFFGRMAVGIGEACLMPAAFAIIARVVPGHRLAMAMSIFAMGATIGSATAILVGGQVIGVLERGSAIAIPLLDEHRPWQIVLILTGLPGIVLAPICFLLPRLDHARGSTDSGQPLLPFLRVNARYLSGLILGYAMVLIMAYGLSAWFPTYLIRYYDLSTATAATLFVASSMPFGLLGFVVPSMVVDRFFAAGRHDAHLRYGLFAAGLMTLLALICFGFSPGLVTTLALVAAINFLFPMNGIVAAHLQMATPPVLRGRVSAIMILVSNVLGLAIGPSMVALLTDHVVGGPAHLGHAIAWVFAIAGSISALLFLSGLTGARCAIRRASPLPKDTPYT